MRKNLPVAAKCLKEGAELRLRKLGIQDEVADKLFTSDLGIKFLFFMVAMRNQKPVPKVGIFPNPGVFPS